MTLNVLYCSDNNYAPYLGISMTSLLESNKSADEIVVYAVLNGVLDDNKDRLRRQIARYGESRRLIIVDGDECASRLSALGLVPYRGSQAANLRLLFTEYIEPCVDRLLYLDCDTLVIDELCELFGADMGDSPAAVVLDSLSDAPYKKMIGFKKEDQYFNSGMILFDVKNWTSGKFRERMQALIEQTKGTLPNNDQDLLNLLLKDSKTVISPKYNFQTTHKVYSDKRYFSVYAQDAYYTPSEIAKARSAPTVLHAYRFLGQFPWHKKALHPWHDEFLRYKGISEWADLPPADNRGGLFTAERIAYKLLPSFVFLPLFRRLQIAFFRKKIKKLRKAQKGSSKG